MKLFKRAAIFASALILVLFIVFVFNQTVQIVHLAENVSPVFGKLVFWTLLAIYALLITIPALLFLRLPRSLVPPASDATNEFDTYLKLLAKRLSSNSQLTNMDLSSRQSIEKALSVLGESADGMTQKAALDVFMSTAISQSGRLDTLLVLSVQSRLVFQIARLYYQRPTLRELAQLYANVVGTAFVAGELDDVDISSQVEPLLSSAVGTMVLSVPGLRAVTSILINSAMTGAANAFLTLRVGIIAKRYCGSLVVAERRSLRRVATAEAATMLGSIVRKGTGRLSRVAWEASKGKVSGAFGGVSAYAKETGRSLFSNLGRKAKKTDSTALETKPNE